MAGTCVIHRGGLEGAALQCTNHRERHAAHFVSRLHIKPTRSLACSSAGTTISTEQQQQHQQQQVPCEGLLLPAFGGRVARSEQLQQRALSKIKSQQSKRRATVNVAKLLTNQIAAATSLEQLHELVVAHGEHLDHIHVAKLLSRTSQLCTSAVHHQQQQQQPPSMPAPAKQDHLQQERQGGRQWQQQQEVQELLLGKLTAMMLQRVRHTTAQSLVAAVAAFGRMASLNAASSHTGLQPQQLQQLADRAMKLVVTLNVSQLAVVLWGLAKAGFKPGSSSISSQWLQPMLSAFMQQYHLAHERQQRLHHERTVLQQSTQQQSQQEPAADDPRLQRPLLPSSNQRRQQQEHLNLQQLQQQQQQQPLDPAYQQHPQQHSLSTDLALVMYALAVMGRQPEAGWLSAWQAAVLQQLPAATAQDLAQGLWSLSSLGLSPERCWLQQVLAASEPLLASAGSQSLSNMGWAVSRFAQTPPQPWLQAYAQAIYKDPTLAGNPQAFSSCLASLARLKCPVEPSRLSALLEQTTEQLAAFTPWQLTNTVWGCASLTVRPSPAWTRTFLSSAAKLADAGKLSVNQLASVIWSLAVLQQSGHGLLASQQLQIQVMLNALAAASGVCGLQHLGAAGRSGLAWALAALGMVPSQSWLAQYLAAAFECGLASDQVRCANVLFCIASLDFEYLVEWLGDFLAGEGDAGVAGGLDLSLEKYAALAGVLAALSEMDSRQLRASWLDLSNTEWSPETSVGEGVIGFSLQLPPGLAAWVDNMLAVPAVSSLKAPTSSNTRTTTESGSTAEHHQPR